ncbi:hypothetical protein GCM10007919_16060 [Rhizobium indigoferae]|nr:hypothetical protein GCM10007919_16060 [Rhizobium indigoferae]
MSSKAPDRNNARLTKVAKADKKEKPSLRKAGAVIRPNRCGVCDVAQPNLR